MKKALLLITALLIALGLSGCCFCCLPVGGETSSKMARNISAGPVQRETRQVSLDGADEVEVTLRFVGGQLDIGQAGGKPLGSGELLNGEFVYNLDDLKPETVYDVQRGRGELLIRHKEDVIRWERPAEIRNEWKLLFTQDVPLEFDLDIGASTGVLELGGLRITHLDLTAGAADVTIRFDQPNPERLKVLHVRSDAARLELLELGNANADELTFDGGLGTYTFGFGGQWQRSARVHIQAGASQVTIRVPRDIGVRVCPGDLRSGDYDGLKKQGDCYGNALYDQSDIQLDIDLELGLGRLVLRQE